MRLPRWRFGFRVRPRLGMRGMMGLVALAALGVWGGLWIYSPARRLEGMLDRSQPAYLRREAAASLGYAIPSWETDRAVGLLIRSLDDAEPRVREAAGAGLYGLGPRAEAATDALLARFKDVDRGVRQMAAMTLPVILAPDSPRKAGAIEALKPLLDDPDGFVRLRAGMALIELGLPDLGAPAIAEAIAAGDSLQAATARHFLRQAGDTRPFQGELFRRLGDPDPMARERAFALLVQIAPPDRLRAAVKALTKSDDAGVRDWAAGAVGTLELP